MTVLKTETVMLEVLRERVTQFVGYGDKNAGLSLHEYLGILIEDVGEAAKSINDSNRKAIGWLKELGNLDRARAELIQTAATAVGMVEAIDNRIAAFRKKTKP